jgi:hypothetical protein
MALSADPVIQAATRITAGAAGVPAETVFPYTVVFSLIVGLVAVVLGSLPVLRQRDEAGHAHVGGGFVAAELDVTRNRYGVALAVLVPTVLIGEGC